VEADPTTRLISFLKDRGSARVVVSYYDNSLKEETLIYWIGELEIYFEYENIQDPNQVRFSMTKLKGHVALWWDML
jgi:hypothetical protein